jgi:hypothetical protein
MLVPATREMTAESTGACADEMLERPHGQHCSLPRKLALAAGAASLASLFPRVGNGNGLVSPSLASLERSAGSAAVVPPKTPQQAQNGETGTARVPLVRDRLPELR